MKRNRPTAERAAPRLGVAASIALHLGLVAALFVSFSKKIDLPAENAPLVPVDLVTIGEETNVAPMQKAAEPLKPPEVKDVEPTPQNEVAPPKFEVAPDSKPVPKEAPPPKEAAKFDINDIEKLLKTKNAKSGPRNIQGVGAQTGMTADLASVLRSQINRCWRRPDFGPNPERLVVRYRLFLNRDGTIAQPPQMASESGGDAYMRAAAESASRAIYACAPYRLPADKYNQWRDSTVTFTPRDPEGF